MTQYTIKTTANEADQIVKGDKTFVFRGLQYRYGYGDFISFKVFNGTRSMKHPIDEHKYIVTYVSDEAPLERGWKVVGFKAV